MTTEKWGVWCRVSGGVTGHRESWLKSHDKPIEFDTKEEAEAEAKKCRDSISPYSHCSFHYYAERRS